MTLGPASNMNEMSYKRQEEASRQVFLAKFLHAMKEDLTEWMSSLHPDIKISPQTFISSLENGVILCQHARYIQRYANEYAVINPDDFKTKIPSREVRYTVKCAYPGSFIARDNVANFISWCRDLGIPDVVMFETEDLVSHKNEKSVILTLIDVARYAYKFGVEPPEIVKFEEEIDEEIERDKENERLGKPIPKPFDLEAHNNLDEMVRNIVDQCTCFDQFPIKKLSEGKYQFGPKNILIYVRIMRRNVMVRVGGGWDTFDHFIIKHDPCRTKIAGQMKDNMVSSNLAQVKKETSTPTKRSNIPKSNMKSSSSTKSSCDNCSVCSDSSSTASNEYGNKRRSRDLSLHSLTNSSYLDDSNSEESDMSIQYKSNEELDHNTSLDSLKDKSIYDNKADRWLRNQLNSFKQQKVTSHDENLDPSEQFKMRRGYTADVIERNKTKTSQRESPQQKASSIRRITSQPRFRKTPSPNNVLQPCDNSNTLNNRKFSMDRQLTTDSIAIRRQMENFNRSLTSLSSTEGSKSFNDMSTQTDFDKQSSKSTLERRLSLRKNDSFNSRIPRPTLQRSRTSDSISTSRLRKRLMDRQGIPRLNKEKLNPASTKPTMRREKSDLTTGRIKKKQNTKPATKRI